jgi:hypothetical protein
VLLLRPLKIFLLIIQLVLNFNSEPSEAKLSTQIKRMRAFSFLIEITKIMQMITLSHIAQFLEWSKDVAMRIHMVRLQIF